MNPKNEEEMEVDTTPEEGEKEQVGNELPTANEAEKIEESTWKAPTADEMRYFCLLVNSYAVGRSSRRQLTFKGIPGNFLIVKSLHPRNLYQSKRLLQHMY